MAKNLYYFRSATLNKVVRGLGASYRLIPLDRRQKDQPTWDLPAVLIADEREDDLKSLSKLAPKDDTWRMICLLEGEKPPRTELERLRPSNESGVPAIVTSTPAALQNDVAGTALRSSILNICRS